MRRLVLLAPLLLAACSTSRRAVPGPEGPADLSCVPYARSRSGLALRGDAWEWWAAAAGRYPRDRTPRAGAVLVFLRTARLRQGHVSVVTRVVGAREIRVDHANWASGAAKGRVARDQPVFDVSDANDWSLVRVWNAATGELGTRAFPTYGFIHPA